MSFGVTYIKKTIERERWFVGAHGDALCAKCHHERGGDVSEEVTVVFDGDPKCERCGETRSAVLSDVEVPVEFFPCRIY